MSQTNETIDTGIKFFGQRVLLEKSRDEVFDNAVKRYFVKDYNKSGPLLVNDLDGQICLAGPKTQRTV